MNKKNILALAVLLSMNCFAQKQRTVITDDIANFWNAYDKIVQTNDSLQQIELINSLYISKGTPGLAGIMEARRYTAAEYVHAIRRYPQFWNSIRNNTLRAGEYADKIEKAIEKLRALYPRLKPASIYFTIGIFRTGGTAVGDKVLIGSEISMGDKNTVTSEFNSKSTLKTFFTTNPINNLAFLNVHEYTHTQQKTSTGNTLLAQCVLEGVAEFIAEKALDIESPNPQIARGRPIEEKLKKSFVNDIFKFDFGKWLWNSAENEFGIRDLGYFMGYAICEKYYNLSKDKKQAVKEMIQLDYNNDNDLFNFVDKTRYFDMPLSKYKETFENSRPVVVRIEPFENGNQNVNPDIKKVTLFFSQPMSTNADFDIGPLGDKNVMWIEKRIGFSDDGLSYSFEIAPLEHGKQYQLVATGTFVNASGIPLKPFLIDFKTSK